MPEVPLKHYVRCTTNGKLEVFGKRFTCKRAKVVTIKQIYRNSKDKSFKALFKAFKFLFSCHTSKENTFVVFIEDENEPENVHMLWCCSHFENTGVENISALSYFLQELKCHMAPYAGIHIDLLDGFWEKLLITVYNSGLPFPEHLKDIKNPNIEY